MSELKFCLLDESGLQTYHAWFQDAELKRRIELPSSQWFNYVRNTPGIYCWIIYAGNIPVGQLQMDTYPNNTGSFGLVVNPEWRNQGYGKRILKAFLMRPEVTRLAQLEVTIEPDNLAALRCVQQAGFIQSGVEPDHEGFLHFIYNCRFNGNMAHKTP